MLSRIRASIAGEVVGRQRPGQLEVVVEAVVDGRADARASCPGTGRGPPRPGRARPSGASASSSPCGAVRRGARRPSRARAPRGRSSSARSASAAPPPRCPVPRSSCSPPRESRNLSSIDRTRGFTPAVPPAFAQPSARRARGRANGRRPGRFAGRSRVVPIAESTVGLRSRGPALWGSAPRGASRSTLCFVMWWATLDSNQ